MARTTVWDIFCRVIDNLGDIGVCWRLSADLAGRGHQVRLWVDAPDALRWMAPGALEGRWPGVRVLRWTVPMDPALLSTLEPADVWIEGFGCEPDAGLLAQRFDPGRPVRVPPPVWIDLEYLSAEPYAARSHGLPSPIGQGPARGHTRWFFFPGLTAATGGLLREPGLPNRRSGFDRARGLEQLGIPWTGERLVSLFCYEPQALGDMLLQLTRSPERTRLLVPQGRGAQAVRDVLGLAATEPGIVGLPGSLALQFLPPLPQADFDRLLWACDLNYVRGEDSLVRALWAGKPFVWQIYPQDDGAHHAKLLAMLRALDAPPSWQHYHLAWNGLTSGPLPGPDAAQWAQAVDLARGRLLAQSDLCQRLCAFVEQLRMPSGSAAKQS